ncbi:MAG: nitrous oxide-stimulated promoter family protein [Spirochaetaceae bacterium]
MDKISREKKIVNLMILSYCKKIHKSKQLCPECNNLTIYSNSKLDLCRYGTDKPNCRNCNTHCYNKDNKKSIKKIMGYIGPRMLYLMPKEFIKHILNFD